MEKTCEFCTIMRPVVYCKADGAHLCLSCDAKIHSANALSSRHMRNILCDACRHCPSCVRCFDHKMFMCRNCDRSLHEVSSLHQKLLITYYTGCPSAKDFAASWGFDLNELYNGALQHQFVSSSFDSDVLHLGIRSQSCPQMRGSSTIASCVEFEVGSSSQPSNVFFKGQQKENTCFVLQQILDLERLQFTECSNSSPSLRGQEQTAIRSPEQNNSQKLVQHLDHHSQYSGTDLQQRDHPLQELKEEPLPFSFSQSENLVSSSISLHGESFWQCKSPIQGSQFWSQTMQDLGVCEELVGHDDFKIPDVDVTFRNFEELFGGDQDPAKELLDDKDVPCSSVEKDMSLDISENICSRGMEDAQGDSFATHLDIDVSNRVQKFSDSMDFPCPIRPSYTTLSSSGPRFRAKSNTAGCVDSRLPPNITGTGPPCYTPELEDAYPLGRENSKTRYKENKKGWMPEKKIRYVSRKARTKMQHKVKG